MTETTKPRTLEQIERDAWDDTCQSCTEPALRLIREAYALGAASRASPDAAPDRDMGWATCEECSRIVPSDEIEHIVCGECAGRASPDEGRAVIEEAVRGYRREVEYLRGLLSETRRVYEADRARLLDPIVRAKMLETQPMIIVAPPPAPTEETREEPPPLCTGGGTVNAAFMPMASSLPTEGTCGVCRQRVPLMTDATTIAPHGYRAPPPEDSGAREPRDISDKPRQPAHPTCGGYGGCGVIDGRCPYSTPIAVSPCGPGCECVGTASDAPASSKEGGR